MESKPSQNGAQNAPEIDLMLRTLKSDFEQTLPHFCSFLAFRALQKSSRNRLKNSIPVTSSKKWYKKRHFSDFRPSWLPNWLQHGSPKLAQNRPKTWKNRLQISTSLLDAPKMASNLEKHPKICTNLQKCYQHGRTMRPKFYYNPCPKRLQAQISWELENLPNMCNNRLPQYQLGCIMRSMD